MYTVRKSFKFEAAHILSKAYSQACSDCIHGHSYKVEVFVSSTALDNSGMVIDFGMLKKMIDPLIQAWDHALLIPKQLLTIDQYVGLQAWNKKIVVVPTENPTAEWMAKYIYIKIKGHPVHNFMNINATLNLVKVRVWETETGYAEYEVK